jgi:hypothetical protein
MAFCSVGCGGPFTGEVAGKVMYKGEPLPGGIVTISHPDGRVAKCTIHEDGSYSIRDAPGGEVTITVQTVPRIPGVPGLSEPVYPAGKYVKIPDKYAKPSQSGLHLQVRRGSQEFPIELTD